MKKKALFLLSAMIILSCNLSAQQNDSNTPLHLLKPAYRNGYGVPTVSDVIAKIDQVFHYVEANTPARLIDGKPEVGAFRLTSYEWGVTYSALLAAYGATGDATYRDYVVSRMQFFIDHSEHYRQVTDPRALDDAGAVCAAMCKALVMNPKLNFRKQIDHYMDYILHKEYRLDDGTFARKRPMYNSVWLDDMFMGISPIARYAMVDKAHANDYYTEIVNQISGFKKRMWVPEKKLFRHGWVESMQPHPAFHWGRANGWAILTLCEVLDVLPADFHGREEVLQLLREHIEGLTALQGGDGFWHQLLDRSDSYLETSATAIYTYCIAHAINKGWIDAKSFGPAAILGWHAVSSKINHEGQVEGVCVGTGMGFDPAFYYYRPVNVFAAHGYGPAIWAGAEIIQLLKTQHPRMNDSAVLFYDEEPQSKDAIFSVEK